MLRDDLSVRSKLAPVWQIADFVRYDYGHRPGRVILYTFELCGVPGCAKLTRGLPVISGTPPSRHLAEDIAGAHRHLCGRRPQPSLTGLRTFWINPAFHPGKPGFRAGLLSLVPASRDFRTAKLEGESAATHLRRSTNVVWCQHRHGARRCYDLDRAHAEKPKILRLEQGRCTI